MTHGERIDHVTALWPLLADDGALRYHVVGNACQPTWEFRDEPCEDDLVLYDLPGQGLSRRALVGRTEQGFVVVDQKPHRLGYYELSFGVIGPEEITGLSIGRTFSRPFLIWGLLLLAVALVGLRQSTGGWHVVVPASIALGLFYYLPRYRVIVDTATVQRRWSSVVSVRDMAIPAVFLDVLAYCERNQVAVVRKGLVSELVKRSSR